MAFSVGLPDIQASVKIIRPYVLLMKVTSLTGDQSKTFGHQRQIFSCIDGDSWSQFLTLVVHALLIEIITVILFIFDVHHEQIYLSVVHPTVVVFDTLEKGDSPCSATQILALPQDGLFLVTTYPDTVKNYTKTILTPNAVEFSRLYNAVVSLYCKIAMPYIFHILGSHIPAVLTFTIQFCLHCCQCMYLPLVPITLLS